MLHQDRVSLGSLGDCPKQTVQTLLETQDSLGASSETHALACALDKVRNSQDLALKRSSLGSRLCLYLAERETDQDRREKLASEGVALAETAITQGGNEDGSVHYYLATNLGLAVREHVTLAMENLGKLENALKQAVALSPGLDDGGPLRVLGALYLKAPAWPNGIGDLDKALDLLGKAVKEHPVHPLNHLFYAQALWQEDSETNAALVKNEIAMGLKLLNEGQWGYRKGPWLKEFGEFQQEVGDGGADGRLPLALKY